MAAQRFQIWSHHRTTVPTSLDELNRLSLQEPANRGDLRKRAEQAEKEANCLAKEWQAKREPARAALGELKTGAEKAWDELKAALDSAITKFREPS